MPGGGSCSRASRLIERRLPGAGDADERDGLPGLDARRDVLEDRHAVVAEGEIAELNLAANHGPAEAGHYVGSPLAVRRLLSASGSATVVVCNRRHRVQHLQHPLPARHAALEHVRDPAEGDHRPASIVR